MNSNGAITFLEAVQSLSKEIKDSFKQSSLTAYAAKNDKAPPGADLFANLPNSSNFNFSASPLFSTVQSYLNPIWTIEDTPLECWTTHSTYVFIT